MEGLPLSVRELSPSPLQLHQGIEQSCPFSCLIRAALFCRAGTGPSSAHCHRVRYRQRGSCWLRLKRAGASCCSPTRQFAVLTGKIVYVACCPQPPLAMICAINRFPCCCCHCGYCPMALWVVLLWFPGSAWLWSCLLVAESPFPLR